jgi:hypothetical protein
MRFLMRWGFRFTVLAVVLVVALVLLKDLLLKEALQAHIQRETGLETRVGRFELGLVSPTLTVQDLRIYNPPEYGGSVFLHVADFHVEYDRAALAQRSLHLRLVRVDIPEATVVEGRSGQSNLEAIQKRLQRRQAASAPKMDWTFDGVDMLNVSLGRLRRLDLRSPGAVETYDLGLQNETFHGLKNQGDVLLALGRVVVKLGVRFLTNQSLGLPQAAPAVAPGAPVAGSGGGRAVPVTAAPPGPVRGPTTTPAPAPAPATVAPRPVVPQQAGPRR